MSTDASNDGWGASLPPRLAAGIWDTQSRQNHTNVLGLQAVFNGLRHFQAELRNRSVLVMTDSTTVVAYINRQGGTRSPCLCSLTWDMCHGLIRNSIVLRATHIPGVGNTMAPCHGPPWFPRSGLSTPGWPHRSSACGVNRT